MRLFSPLLAICAASACCLAAAQSSSQPGQQAPPKIEIALVGDSTQTRNAGYGLGFCANLAEDVICINDAKAGASTKTYYDEGYWAIRLFT